IADDPGDRRDAHDPSPPTLHHGHDEWLGDVEEAVEARAGHDVPLIGPHRREGGVLGHPRVADQYADLSGLEQLGNARTRRFSLTDVELRQLGLAPLRLDCRSHLACAGLVAAIVHDERMPMTGELLGDGCTNAPAGTSDESARTRTGHVGRSLARRTDAEVRTANHRRGAHSGYSRLATLKTAEA